MCSFRNSHSEHLLCFYSRGRQPPLKRPDLDRWISTCLRRRSRPSPTSARWKRSSLSSSGQRANGLSTRNPHQIRNRMARWGGLQMGRRQLTAVWIFCPGQGPVGPWWWPSAPIASSICWCRSWTPGAPGVTCRCRSKGLELDLVAQPVPLINNTYLSNMG